MKKALLATAVASMAAALAVNVNAADIRWNGFASVAGGISTSTAKRSDGQENELYGYDSDFNFRPETKLALQASSDLGNGLSVTAQAIARGADAYTMEMEWAFVTYEFGDANRVNVGRMRIPFFMYSDYLDVGYAYPWIRPPASVYDFFSSRLDGVNLQFNGALGSWDSSLQFVGGRNVDDLNLAPGQVANAELANFLGGAWAINNDWLTLRAAYFQADATILLDDLTAIKQGWEATPFPQVADKFAMEGDVGNFIGLGAKIEKNGWLMVVEGTQIDVADSWNPKQTSSYITLAKTFNDLTFHVTYEMEEDKPTDKVTADVPFPSGNPGLDGLYQVTNGFINSLQDKNTTMTVGMKYNFHPSASFKIDYSQRTWDSESTLDFTDDTAGVLSFSIDTVF